MDILVSSNLERLLFELAEKNGSSVASYMSALSFTGRYDVPLQMRENISSIFAAGYCSEENTMRTIADTYNDSGYLIDTHTAVAGKALMDYRESSGDQTTTVVVSTASPFKFCDSVLKALGRTNAKGGVELIDVLSKLTGCAIPAPLYALKSKAPRFLDSIQTDEMKAAVTGFLE